MLSLLLLSACSDDNNRQTSTAQDADKPQTATSTAPKAAPQTAVLSSDGHSARAYLEHNELYNPESVIPPQCYTRTEGVNNPCYVCHQSYDDKQRPNFMRDAGLQGLYAFSDVGETNSWVNLFADRSEQMAAISDDEIRHWIVQDNYSGLIQRLKQNPDWKGELPELANLAFPEKAFDSQGFAVDGSLWVAFNYKPFPSSFWPTNGSTGDVMVRLPAAFRELKGEYNQDLYLANLSLMEMTIKRLESISTPALDEQRIGIDLDGDGKLNTNTTRIQAREHYLGDASGVATSYMLYPKGTEFLHTVRYVGVDDAGNIYNAPRMKEVRYMRKHQETQASILKSSYFLEAKEKHLEQMPQTVDLLDRGIDNRFGWTINGYIEDDQGELRHQTHQELAFCNGCHKSVGSTIDQVFSFARKVEGAQGWGYIDLKAMKDVPNIGEQQGEYLTYFERAGGGDEFRQNPEMMQRWFTAEGKVNQQAVQQAGSLYELITPSPERALALNKAYKVIVDEQGYLFGRDAVLSPAKNVLTEVDQSTPPLKPEHRYQWDMRLQWHDAANEKRLSDASGH